MKKLKNNDEKKFFKKIKIVEPQFAIYMLLWNIAFILLYVGLFTNHEEKYEKKIFRQFLLHWSSYNKRYYWQQ